MHLFSNPDKMILNPYRYASSGSLLLDQYSGALLAFSLRQISSSYSGSAIRIRESGSNTETDIGFSSGSLDTAAIASHCGGNNGYVVTWYDQSGNGNDATNATEARQPQIYNGSSTITDPDLGNVSIYATGTNLLLTPAVDPDAGGKRFSVFSAHYKAAGRRWFLSQFSGANWIVSDGQSTTYCHYDGTWRGTSTLSTTSLFMSKAWIRNGDTTLRFYEGGSQLGTDITIGNVATSSSAMGVFNHTTAPSESAVYLSEIILYDSDQSSNLPGITSDVETFWGI